MYISSDVKRRKKWRRRLFTFYTLPPWRVLILPRQTEKEKREMRERDKKTGAKGHVGLHNSVGKRGTYTQRREQLYTVPVHIPRS
jgi:hypothetical protein